MATKKYNPYNSARKIVDLKGSYDSAKWQNGNYKQYQDEAVQYYNDLINNGYVQQASDFSKLGYEDALNYLNNSGWKSDEENEFDEWYDNLGKVSTGDKRTVSEQQTDYIDKLMGIGTGETSPQTSDAVSKLMDQWFADKQVQSEYAQNQMDYLNNFDYTQQSYYQPIMDSYNLYGQNAANGALASGASGNAGNIDSYAAANAARQQLAFTNAGHQAALAAAAQNQANWQNVYNAYIGDNSNTANMITSMYSTDADRAKAANDVIRQLFGDESAERTNATNAMVDKYLADLGLVQSQYVTDADERMNTANNEYGLEIQKLANELGMTEAQLLHDAEIYGYNVEESMNSANNQAAMERLLKEYELENAKNVKSAQSIKGGTPLVDEEAAYKAQFGGTGTASKNEMISYLKNAITQMQTGKYSDMTTFDDVKSAVLEVFPQFENEIDNYISDYTKQSIGNIRGIRSRT